ncbi:MAG: hypothetical protein VYA34_17130 [Myxococcota bacterium]|nr:hypothetical protein [Myxococcota bacterium]
MSMYSLVLFLFVAMTIGFFVGRASVLERPGGASRKAGLESVSDDS